jgi:hypothetical protein
MDARRSVSSTCLFQEQEGGALSESTFTLQKLAQFWSTQTPDKHVEHCVCESAKLFHRKIAKWKFSVVRVGSLSQLLFNPIK